jgi:hypothetical protein
MIEDPFTIEERIYNSIEELESELEENKDRNPEEHYSEMIGEYKKIIREEVKRKDDKKNLLFKLDLVEIYKKEIFKNDNYI